jgi:hypothetical protein
VIALQDTAYLWKALSLAPKIVRAITTRRHWMLAAILPNNVTDANAMPKSNAVNLLQCFLAGRHTHPRSASQLASVS